MTSMIPTVGLNLIRSMLVGDGTAKPSHMAVGTGAVAPAAGDTALGAETNRNSLAAQSKPTDGILEYIMTLASTEGNGNTLTECGIFNAAAAGSMLERSTHTGFAKTNAFSVKYIIRQTISNV